MRASSRKATDHVKQVSGGIGPGRFRPKESDLTALDVVRARYRMAKLAERRSLNARATTVAARLACVFGPSRGARIARRWQRRTGDRRCGLVALILEHSQVA